MNSVSDDIKDILEDSSNGVGGTFVTASYLTESQDEQIAIVDQSGFGIVPSLDNVENYNGDGFQVLVRGDKMARQATYTKAQVVNTILNGLTNETWNSTRYISILRQGSIVYVGEDENNRHIYSLNYIANRAA